LPGAQFSSDGNDMTAGDRAVLSANAKARTTAQLILRIAPRLDSSDLSASDMAYIVEVLQQAGLTKYSGRLAAMDFLGSL